MKIFSFLCFLWLCVLKAEPYIKDGKIHFSFEESQKKAQRVSVVLFHDEKSRSFPMQNIEGYLWACEIETASLLSGIYDYQFRINRFELVNDPKNSFLMPDTLRSAFVLSGDKKKLILNLDDIDSKDVGSMKIALLWHMHQPFYNSSLDKPFMAPWVRCHSTSAYFAMPYLLSQYPQIACTINLTGSLLFQINKYIKVFKECVDPQKKKIDATRYFSLGESLDPWIDLLLKETSSFDFQDDQLLCGNGGWHCFAINPLQIAKFPEYQGLKNKNLSIQEKRTLKFFFFLAWFHDIFLRKEISLPTGLSSNVCDFIKEKDGKFFLLKEVSEDDCYTLLYEVFKVMQAILPMHKSLSNLELTTTPFFHPIMPLLISSDAAEEAPFSSAFKGTIKMQFEEDAEQHVIMALEYFKEIVGYKPLGMWPAEGAVSKEMIPILAKHGVKWIATDEDVLKNSMPDCSPLKPYNVGYQNQSIEVFFRKTNLSNCFFQQADLEKVMASLLRMASHSEERIVVLISDGENPWEYYQDNGYAFLSNFYGRLNGYQKKGILKTTTPSKYLLQKKLETIDLRPGTWMSGSFETWVGEDSENLAWEMCFEARQHLEKYQIPRPQLMTVAPIHGSKEYYAWKAWTSLYIAQSSDWYWWFGSDQNCPGEENFRNIFLQSLQSVYNNIFHFLAE